MQERASEQAEEGKTNVQIFLDRLREIVVKDGTRGGLESRNKKARTKLDGLLDLAMIPLLCSALGL